MVADPKLSFSMDGVSVSSSIPKCVNTFVSKQGNLSCSWSIIIELKIIWSRLKLVNVSIAYKNSKQSIFITWKYPPWGRKLNWGILANTWALGVRQLIGNKFLFLKTSSILTPNSIAKNSNLLQLREEDLSKRRNPEAVIPKISPNFSCDHGSLHQWEHGEKILFDSQVGIEHGH